MNRRWLLLLVIGHALLLLAGWWEMFHTHVGLFSARWWLVLAWLWVAWPFVLFVFPARPRLLNWIAVGTGVLFLIPCVPWVFAFTVWTIWGFAP
jgi:hypothetical protein